MTYMEQTDESYGEGAEEPLIGVCLIVVSQISPNSMARIPESVEKIDMQSLTARSIKTHHRNDNDLSNVAIVH